MQDAYEKIEKILKEEGKKPYLLLTSKVLHDSKAKTKKKQFHIYGKDDVQLLNRPKQKTYVVGVIMQKNYVGFYSMGYYAFPKGFDISKDMQKLLVGKSCFGIKEINEKIEKEIRKIVRKNILIFKKEKYI